MPAAQQGANGLCATHALRVNITLRRLLGSISVASPERTGFYRMQILGNWTIKSIGHKPF
jgi:hypothetical protein